MAISISHAPSFAAYGSLMADSARDTESYDRMRSILDLMAPLGQREKESQRDQRLREKALAQQQEDALRQYKLALARLNPAQIAASLGQTGQTSIQRGSPGPHFGGIGPGRPVTRYGYF